MDKSFALLLSMAFMLFSTATGTAQEQDSLSEPAATALSAKIGELETRQSALERLAAHLPRISGYIQAGYEWSDDVSTFFIKRARLDLQGDISPKIDYRLQVEFAAPKIVDIYFRFRPMRALNVQIGQFKVPFTIENTHYVPLKFEFIEYSMAVARLMGFEDVSGIIDSLRSRQAIIVDFRRVAAKDTQRVLDFLSGALYALGGSQERIGDGMFLFTPEGVTIQGPLSLKRRYD